MKSLPTRLDGSLLLAPAVYRDDRGFFCETFRDSAFAELGVSEPMVQDNHSRSSYGVVRGIHFQIGEGCSKLVRCARGAIWDVLVDLRRGSPTYGSWEGFDLTDENMHVLYAPVGFGHGFCVRSEVADVCYKQSSYYSAEVERGIAYDDAQIAIDWPIPVAQRIVSERDATAPSLAQVAAELPFRLS
jgi:dTDP-4-dehydrorhamnose 3,5-epimerase